MPSSASPAHAVLVLALLSAGALNGQTTGTPAPDSRGNLALTDGGRTILTYQAATADSPDPASPWYARSGFIHPVRTPSGRIVTNDFPADHLHQHGLMMAWTSALINGRKVDFWNSHKKEGRVEHVETVRADADTIVVKLRHLNDTVQPPETVLLETWQITRVPHPTMHVFDLVSTQACVMPQALQIKKYHYGGLCVRGAAGWAEGLTVTTSGGRNRADGNHAREKWVAMSGVVDGAPCGLACLGHPNNFRAPQPVRIHPEMPYFSFAPAVLGDFEITPDAPFISRYRFVAFDGAPDRRNSTSSGTASPSPPGPRPDRDPAQGPGHGRRTFRRMNTRGEAVTATLNWREAS